jgi:NAD(P)-dependent dehydrogenase (short-subunit alcohol dehydrogenase family)
MAETRIALVTGANRGIGFEIVRQLERLGIITVLSARDPAKAQAAADKLLSEGIEVGVVPIDVDSDDSVAAGLKQVEDLFGGRLDILVNNAGIMIDGPSTGTTAMSVSVETIANTFNTNVLGPLRLIQRVIPLMQKNNYGRIVNMSSGLGQLSEMGGQWPAYRLSKASVNVLTRVFAAEIGPGNIKINSMHPGWVKTDMGGPNAERDVAQGAETAVWLATLPDDGPTGGFFRDKKPMAW